MVGDGWITALPTSGTALRSSHEGGQRWLGTVGGRWRSSTPADVENVLHTLMDVRVWPRESGLAETSPAVSAGPLV